ncbi:dTDP-glucose 4,6-dehydratase [Bradyrhizobium sp. MOS002]|uniref:dTDP-glucose 4,6-dehydratase n=1 Tax=Bradyrhizobium sp. MOS002 TaxID=2133947 RepID=UPI000D115460|nr:dTDP-glucose 4,6-dehydratase [Bradyrhizobium sp. MOS002]PSO25978.1 dTDP-glucose 4,6-dehydratase [Bradyrhizobium sp. MOS002]
MTKRILVTGGCGFIGSALIRQLIAESDSFVTNIDKLTYAADPTSLSTASDSPRYRFEQVDICNGEDITRAIANCGPDLIVHLAAETHVDRSIDGPAPFVTTNVFGTFQLLESCHAYWTTLPSEQQRRFRFHHVSTDEVFGSLSEEGLFSENSSYRPNSPYAASKASSDHFVRAWHTTFGLPVLISSCSNNYGPSQFPEKLIPLTILSALRGRKIPIYGDGRNVRDWLHVDDHCRALRLIQESGTIGHSYNIGARNERTNLDVVLGICAILDQICPRQDKTSYGEQISFVPDRPGHDRRYAIDPSKMEQELGWRPKEAFESGLLKTVRWYLENVNWCERIEATRYKGERLGLTTKSQFAG